MLKWSNLKKDKAASVENLSVIDFYESTIVQRLSFLTLEQKVRSSKLHSNTLGTRQTGRPNFQVLSCSIKSGELILADTR